LCSLTFLATEVDQPQWVLRDDSIILQNTLKRRWRQTRELVRLFGSLAHACTCAGVVYAQYVCDEHGRVGTWIRVSERACLSHWCFLPSPYRPSRVHWLVGFRHVMHDNQGSKKKSILPSGTSRNSVNRWKLHSSISRPDVLMHKT
jgi:hypothetical protein